MCFQGYVHWLCGHTSLFEESCPEALLLDLPFHLKLACPAYQIISRSQQQYCGTGSFYCSQTPDGIKLDHIHGAFNTCRESIKAIKSQIYGEQGLRKYGQAIVDSLLRNGCKKEDCLKDERVERIYKEVAGLRGELEGLQIKEREFEASIERARVWFEHKAGHVGPNPNGLPPGLYPPSLQVQRPTRRLADLGGNSGRVRGVSMPVAAFQAGMIQNGYLQEAEQPSEQRLPATSYGFFQMGQYQVGSDQLGLQQTGRQHLGPHQPEVYDTGNNTPLSVYQSKPAPKRRQKEPSTDEPSPPIRRSSRVRKKRVTYAEYESDSFSRTPSPEKSDAADPNFSPSKEAAAVTAGRPHMGRSSSLMEKIGDWQKREMSKTLREPLGQGLQESVATGPLDSSGQKHMKTETCYADLSQQIRDCAASSPYLDPIPKATK